MDIREKRIRAITSIYYSNPEVQKAMLKFSQDREVVPRYFEGFGKRPDVLQYPSDVNGLVKKGATSFHASEELWSNPLNIDSEMNVRELDELRSGWDLLIDVDSKYLDVSKILTILTVEMLESFGVNNYGIKFSGSKGFHIIVGKKSFPDEYEGVRIEHGFPEWPRAVCEYLMHKVRPEFNRKISDLFRGIEKNLGDKKAMEALCPECGRPAKKGILVSLECPICHTSIQRKNMKITKKRLKCVQDDCAGVFEVGNVTDYFQCDYCEDVSSISKMETSGRGVPVFEKAARESVDYSSELKEMHSGISHGAADLVLVASRHLFRMPYSLHEKTALASIVLSKEEVENFNLKDADPMNVKVREFMPESVGGEAERLLSESMRWKKERDLIEQTVEQKKYAGKKFDDVKMEGVTDEMFPKPIKKLLKGLEDGRKRGLFVLLTLFKSVGYTPEEIVKKVKEWNEKNTPPLREGYVRSQVDWHLKQTKKILPPNYSNDAFYRDIGILDEKPKAKNPLVEVKNALWRSKH